MDPSIPDRLDQQVQSLVQRLATGCQNDSLGSATVAVYDTAWLSMVSKVDAGQKSWLFPECFQYLLDNQLPNGGWKCDATPDDGLLNTLAALLAIQKHATGRDMKDRADLSDLEARVSKATMYLRDSLQNWEVDDSLPIGFEILLPALLSMLESENIHFVFPGRHKLENLNARKMTRFDLEVLYRTPTTFLHSLEAFIGRLDFDKLTSHKTCGSMMASPSSTAAYLMHTSVWDSEAELYLRKVLREGSGNGNGGVPGVFPIPVFEVSWLLSTLFQAGYSSEALGKENIDKIAVYLQDHLQRQHGLLGFAPSVLADADDTAKALLTLTLSGKAATPDQMIDRFRSKNGHFRTFPGETDASFSANCNVLMALTHMPSVEDYTPCISSILTFLSDCWWSGTFRDKWNKSLQYSMMLLAEGLIQVLILWDKCFLKTLPEALVRDRIPVILIQILNRTLLAQTAAGAWSQEGCLEITAYGILTLKVPHSFPWHPTLQDAAVSAIRSGQQFLDQFQAEWTKPAYTWVGKTTYGSARLSEGYCLAAMKVLGTSYAWSDGMKSLVDIPEDRLSKLLQLFSTLQDFRNEPRWKMVASVQEAYTFLSQLKSAGSNFMPEQRGAKNEYVAFIPLTFILVNNHHRLFLSTNLLWDMMVHSLNNYHVDEYMESVVAKLSDANLEPVKAMIRHLCNAQESENLQAHAKPVGSSERVTFRAENSPGQHEAAAIGQRMNGNDSQSNAIDYSTAGAHERYSVSTLTSVRAVLSHYIRATLNYPAILGASTNDRSNFRNSLCSCLVSHIAQIADNSRFATQSSWNTTTTSVLADPRQTFFSWTHTTGANSTTCPFSFALLTCLLGAASAPSRKRSREQAADCFGSARQNYLAQELCMRLAVFTRLYNDFGSVERDRIEANINSINFPEFHGSAHYTTNQTGEAAAEHENRLKEDLLELATHERHSADMAAEKLLNELEGNGEEGGGIRKRKNANADAVRLFIGAARLYADLYVVRDLSNRITV